MSLEELDFDRETVLNELNRFFDFGYTMPREKIDIIEEALNQTLKKLMKAFGKEERGTHVHKKNMIYTYKELTLMYERCFFHEIGYYNKALAEICLKRFKGNEPLLERVSEIILNEEFTHRDQDILLRPYLFDFFNTYYINDWNRYKQLRERLKQKIMKKVLAWVTEDEKGLELLDERIRPHFEELKTEVNIG